ncbi:MAG: succinate dehydrogenase cytochrome b subunit [Caldilineaceae bacterium]
MSVAAGVINLPRTSIGKKVIMAVTGLIWVGFVTFHMYGNLKILEGAEYFNAYAEGLRSLGAPIFGHGHLLFVARLVLIFALLSHIWAAVTLSMQARGARPKNYALKKSVQATFAALYIRWGGIALFFFVLFHLAHLTWGIPGIHNDFIQGDAYHNMVTGFSGGPAIVFYYVALIALSLHLYHGVWSMFQTLGLNNKEYSSMIRLLALALAIVAPLGFAVPPLAVVLGIVTL